jgi:hypothetical protein
MEPQLIQAMGGLSLAEKGRARAKKAYEGMTEEQKEERRAKQAEQARARRAAKKGVGAGAGEPEPSAEDKAEARRLKDKERKAKKRAETKEASDKAKAEADAKAKADAEAKAKARAEAEAKRPPPRSPPLPETRLAAAHVLEKKYGWTILLADLKPANDTANEHNGKVFPGQFLLVTPDGKTGWWIWTEELEKPFRRWDDGLAPLSDHKFHQDGDVWVEDKPPIHLSGKNVTGDNAFFYLVWDHRKPFPSYEEWTEARRDWKQSYFVRDQKEAWFRSRYEEDKLRKTYIDYLF